MNCSDKITREQLCRMFDHTNLKAYADKDMLQIFMLVRLFLSH